MEILFKGTLPKDRDVEGTCYTCKTRVRFKVGEGTITSNQRDGTFVTVACPVCTNPIYGYIVE